MPTRKPKVIVTRRLPDPVETRMRELFDTQLNLSDEPLDRAALVAAVQTAAVLVPTITAKAAERLRQRAAKLYQRAQQHALRALEEQKPGFAAALASQQAKDWPKLRKEQAGLAYWAAASWGGRISLSKDEPDVVADLPLAIRLAEQAWAADPDWGDGALTGLLGSFEAGRAGGSMQRALGYFDQSIAQSAGRSAGAYLAKAEGYAQPAGDRAMFEQLLQQALAIKDEAGSPLTLQNEVMRRRARWLLSKTDDLF